MIKILHFADAHIDLARQGRHDPQSGLPLRVLDFLKSLDTIVDTAICEKVDLVIFAGDAYRDRTPAPTYQREWGKRIMRLSSAGIPTLMVIGNHDVSPASGRANALQEFETLQVPNVRVISKPCLLKPEDLSGLPLQVIGIPWLNRSGLAAAMAGEEDSPRDLESDLEANLVTVIEGFLDALDPQLPAVLASHVTVQGAVYGNERSVMLGRDFMLPGSLVRDPRLDYVALGHIHKFQNLNPDGKPPVIYPGSIERIDFGEAQDRKIFIMVGLEKGKAELDPRELTGRKFIDRTLTLTEREGLQEKILAAMPVEKEMEDAIFRLVLNYPRDLEALIDDAEIRRKAQSAFEFHLIRRPHIQARLRLSGDRSVASMTSLELLDLYWQTVPGDQKKVKDLDRLAGEIFASVENHSPDGEAGG
jgi:DNA repair protein SbcD/Mre11